MSLESFQKTYIAKNSAKLNLLSYQVKIYSKNQYFSFLVIRLQHCNFRLIGLRFMQMRCRSKIYGTNFLFMRFFFGIQCSSIQTSHGFKNILMQMCFNIFSFSWVGIMSQSFHNHDTSDRSSLCGLSNET